jgi:hypothetical protein
MVQHPLSPGGNTLVILDTCVLLPSRLSDVLFDLMLEGLYFAYWTGEVETEFLRNWPLVHPAASKSGAKRLKAFQQATNNGHLVTGYEHAAFVSRVPARVHDNDRHLFRLGGQFGWRRQLRLGWRRPACVSRLRRWP